MSLLSPQGIFVSNNEVFIADSNNHRIRKLLSNGQIVTIAGNGTQGSDGDGGLATNASLNYPTSIVVSSSNQVYIAEESGHRIRKIDTQGIISTIAGTDEEGYNGDGQLAINAFLQNPCGLFVTQDEEVLFCDKLNYRVRKIDRNGIISTIAGNGIEEERYNGDDQLATLDSLQHPCGVFQNKEEVYIVDMDNDRIRKIDRNGIIHTIAGNSIGNDGNGIATDTILYWPSSICVHNDEIYFTDGGHQMVRKIDRNGIITTIAGKKLRQGFNGDGIPAIETLLNFPYGIFVDSQNQVYVSEGNCVRKITNGIMKIIVGKGEEGGYSGDVPFDFERYPHIGPKKDVSIKPFKRAYYDLIVKFN